MTRLFDQPCAAFLFDMDGTLLSSIRAAERVWAAWARRQGLDVATFLPTIHGRRAIDTIARLQLPGLDATAEAAAITRAEIEDVAGIEAIAGAAAFLASLPADRWALVTSAPRLLAQRRMAAAGLPWPAIAITADDVQRGKPAPDGFLLAAERLGVPIADCLVFEDAPVGIAAAEAAGAHVLVISASHRHPLATQHPMAPGYDALHWTVDPTGALTVEARSAAAQVRPDPA